MYCAVSYILYCQCFDMYFIYHIRLMKVKDESFSIFEKLLYTFFNKNN